MYSIIVIGVVVILVVKIGKLILIKSPQKSINLNPKDGMIPHADLYLTFRKANNQQDVRKGGTEL